MNRDLRGGGVRAGMVPARRAVVLDPDLLDAKLLRFVLEDAGQAVFLADSASTVIAEVGQRETYAVILETELPGITGYQLCSELRGRGYTGPVIFVTHASDPGAPTRAFASGADDFIAKPYDPKELLARVDAAGRRWFNADRQTLGNSLRVGNVELAITDMKFVADDRRPVYLTPTEMRLLECMMRNSSITITRETLIDRAWPNDFIADTNRVDVYVGRLRKKIERDPAEPEYIHTVRGVGYVFRPPPTDHVVELPVQRTAAPEVQG